MNIIVAILLLGLIIIIHELGHFLLAKKNGITVTEFSVGMGPRIASFVKNGTRYSLKVFPFGGSCMMLGEDEVVEDEGAFHKKSVWARFSVIFAGAFFNFILAFVLALIVIGAVGVDYPEVLKAQVGTPAYAAGLREGDRITSINGSAIHFGKEIDMYFFFHPVTGEPIDITYERDGTKYKTVLIPKLNDPFYKLGFGYSGETPNAEVLSVDPDFPFEQAGIAAGDVITKINDTPIAAGNDVAAYFKEHPLTKDSVSITYVHENTEKTVELTPVLVKNNYSLGLYYNVYREKVSALEAIKNSFYEIKFNIMYAINGIGYLITGRVGLNEVTGPVGIVNVVGDIVEETEEEGAGVVLLTLANFGVLLSTNLGVMNLLPLPALDGGRLVFLIIEAIRKKPIAKEKEAMVHLVGLALLMILMVFVLFNDIKKIFS